MLLLPQHDTAKCVSNGSLISVARLSSPSVTTSAIYVVQHTYRLEGNGYASIDIDTMPVTGVEPCHSALYLCKCGLVMIHLKSACLLPAWSLAAHGCGWSSARLQQVTGCNVIYAIAAAWRPFNCCLGRAASGIKASAFSLTSLAWVDHLVLRHQNWASVSADRWKVALAILLHAVSSVKAWCCLVHS